MDPQQFDFYRKLKYEDLKTIVMANNIKFDLTFDQWCAMWADLDELYLKGGDYEIFRVDNKGAYTVDNVCIATVWSRPMSSLISCKFGPAPVTEAPDKRNPPKLKLVKS